MGEIAGMAKAKRTGPTMIQRSRQVPSELKAFYHNVAGAGKSRVIRQFMGLTAQEEKDIEKRVERHITLQFQSKAK